MRLIDVDKLLENLEWLDEYDHIISEAVKGSIDIVQTVEAIPVEWIKKYIEDHTYEMVNPKYVDDTYNYIQFTEKPFDYYLTTMPFQVKVMLKEWKKENENR